MQRRRFDLNLHVEAESPVRFGNPFLPPGETTFSPNQTLNEDCGVYEYLVRQEPSPLPVHSEHFNQTLEYFLSCRDRQIAIVSAAPPFHIQYVNKAWSDACGWNAEEVIGCDCKFLQGEATNAWSITKFMRKICDVDFCGEAELNVLNYRKDGTIISNKLVCVTVKSTDSDDEWDAEKHFACISELTEVFGSVEKTTYKSAKYNPLRELGMPIDRREQCNIYPHFARHPAPKLMEWAKLSSKLNLPLTMQYIIETQAAALLTDSEGHIVHMNPAFSRFMHCQLTDCEALNFEMFIHDFTQPDQLHVLRRMFEDGNDINRLEYANLVLDAGAAARLRKDKPLNVKDGKEVRGQYPGPAPFNAEDLWLCALSATKVSEDLRLVMALWVSEKPISASKIALAPRIGMKKMTGAGTPTSPVSPLSMSSNSPKFFGKDNAVEKMGRTASYPIQVNKRIPSPRRVVPVDAEESSSVSSEGDSSGRAGKAGKHSLCLVKQPSYEYMSAPERIVRENATS